MFTGEMLYNIDFEVCSLLMLFLVLANIPVRSMVRTASNRIFIVFLVCGVFDVLFDIVSAITSSYPALYSVTVMWVTLQIYFLLQITMPLLLLIYVLSLRGALSRRGLPFFIFGGISYSFMMFLVLSNPFLGLLSHYEADGSYHLGPMRHATYIYGFLFVAVCLTDVIRHRSLVSWRNYIAIWQFVALNSAMLLLQMLFKNLLLTGVGIATSLIILIITSNNPLTRIDKLTGLYDSAALREVLHDYNRRSIPVYPLLAALDSLKRINLVFGFEAGNRVLRDCSAMMVAIGGQENTFRLMGDTFLILTHSEQEYKIAVQRVRRLFEAPWDIEQAKVHLTAAVCGMPDPHRHTEAGEMLDYIDYLLGYAKATGAAAFVEDDEALTALYERSKRIEAYLYTAVQDELFEVYLQPVYSLTQARFVSAEALVRLRHPEFGMIPPGEFIPIAERSGEISHVERAIFRKLCQFLKDQPCVASRLETIKFNLSPASFLSADPGRYLLREIEVHGLDPHLFQFEITETAATVYDEELNNWTNAIKAAGAGLCLDDFGSGYANLSAVMKLPFDVVKMDRSLLVEAGEQEQAAVLYGKLVDALTGLGYCVLAEGAETESEIEFLKRVGVQMVQGYYYARPLPPEDFLKFLDKLPPREKAFPLL